MYRNNNSRSASSRPSFNGSRSSGASGGARFGGNRFSGGRDNPRRSFFQTKKRNVKTFNPSQLMNRGVAAPTEVVEFVPNHSFVDFDLVPQLQQNVQTRGYVHPTPIQDQAMPELLAGRDVIGLADTGTGKTAAFLLPLINKVFQDRTQKVLIVVPTRELAVQIDDEFRQFSAHLGLRSVVCIGGVNIRPQINRLMQHAEFVIGTPGRLRDLEQQRALNFRDYNNVVLDEVDQMLDMGFLREIQHITGRLPEPRQSLFFSATMPATMLPIASQLLNNPVTIAIKSRDVLSNISQEMIKLAGRPKIEVLDSLLRQDEFEKVLVFMRTKFAAEKLSKMLIGLGVKTASIHGNKSQNQRQRAIEDFKHSYVQVLVATDVASRGLDIDDVSHVINYDLPETHEDYIHRIGRTGRANKIGKALTFLD